MNYGTAKRNSDFNEALLNSFNPEPELKNEEWFELQTFGNGRIIYSRGNRPQGVYYLKSGRVKFSSSGANGTRHIIRVETEGAFLGYEDVLLERRHTSTVEAWGDVSVLFIPYEDFMAVVNSDIKVSRKFSQMLSENLLDTEDRLIGFAHKPVRGRLADALLSLCNYVSKENGSTNISLTRNELADMIGTASETVIRTLTEFKNEKLISTNRKMITVLDQKGLMRATSMYN